MDFLLSNRLQSIEIDNHFKRFDIYQILIFMQILQSIQTLYILYTQFAQIIYTKKSRIFSFNLVIKKIKLEKIFCYVSCFDENDLDIG